MTFRNELIVGAKHVQRPKITGGPFSHEGVVINTNKGNSYLVHNTPKAGVVATPASGMSNKWSTIKSINVNGKKTVDDAMKGGYTKGTGLLSKVGEYVGSGTCKGTAQGVINKLEKK